MLILFTVEPDKRNSLTDHLVPNGEFLQILTFSDRTGKKTLVFVFQSWKMMLDHITLHLKFVKRLHIYQSRMTPNITPCSGTG